MSIEKKINALLKDLEKLSEKFIEIGLNPDFCVFNHVFKVKTDLPLAQTLPEFDLYSKGDKISFYQKLRPEEIKQRKREKLEQELAYLTPNPTP